MDDHFEVSSPGIKFVHVLLVASLIVAAGFLVYPVFSHAKLGGGPSPGYKEIKQLTLAAIMYASEYNDDLPLGTAWNTGRDQLCYPQPVGCFSTWAWSVSPYVRSTEAFVDPNLKGGVIESRPQWATYFIDFGYNYAHLSPMFLRHSASGPIIDVQAVNQTRAFSPADTVMIASKWSSRLYRGEFAWANSFAGGMVADAAVEPPLCSPLRQLCLTNWGRGGFFDQPTASKGMYIDVQEGRYTGGVASRAATQAIVGFLDGHSRKMTPQALAAGTNWTPSILSSGMHVTAPKLYLWSVSKS